MAERAEVERVRDPHPRRRRIRHSQIRCPTSQRRSSRVNRSRIDVETHEPRSDHLGRFHAVGHHVVRGRQQHRTSTAARIAHLPRNSVELGHGESDEAIREMFRRVVRAESPATLLGQRSLVAVDQIPRGRGSRIRIHVPESGACDTADR